MSKQQPTPMAKTWWQTARPWLIRAGVALLPVLGALAARYGVSPRVVEVVTEILVEPPQPLGAESRPIDYENMRYHGDHDEHAPHPLQAQAARWPTDRITYSIDYASARGMNPPLSDAAIQGEARIATGWWSEHLAIEFVEVPHGTAGVNIPCTFARIDGPGGVLAQAYLADGTNRPKPLTLDVSERWVAGPPAANQVALRTVWCHEIGHSLGCDHDAANAPAVMRPTYTSSIPREQERDIARMVQLGYKRREKVPPAPADVLTVPVQIRTADVIEVLKKAGYEVSKP